MLKKIVFGLISLIAAFSIGYAYLNNELTATGGTAAKDVTLRVNKAPENLTGAKSDIGFKAGDKIAIQAGNGDNAWQLGVYRAYTTYDCDVKKYQETAPTRCNKPEINAWLSMTTKPVATDHAFTNYTAFAEDPWITFNGDRLYYGWTVVYSARPSTSLPYNNHLAVENTEVFNQLLNTTGDNVLLTYHDEHYFFSLVEGRYPDNENDRSFLLISDGSPDSFGKKSFIANNYEMEYLNKAQRAFNYDYWMATGAHAKPLLGAGDYIQFVKADGTTIYYAQNRTMGGNIIYVSDIFQAYASTRPSAYLDLTNVVFAASLPKAGTNKSGMNSINATPKNLLTVSGNILKDTEVYDDMVVRLLDTSMSADLNETTPFYHATRNQGLASQNGKYITVRGSKIRLKASGSSGDYISAVVFDEAGTPIYYAPLDTATGSESLYVLDTSTLDEGNYQIAVVSENIPSNRAPSKSSAFSKAYPLAITKGITITPTVKTNLEYSKNVNKNDIVATLSSTGGVLPVTYSLISETNISGHENDYQKFNVSGSNVIVNDINGLDAGDYYFKINAIDANGYPDGGMESDTVHIVVGKTSLTAEFSPMNHTKKSIAEATSGWSEVVTTTPSNGVKVHYSVIGGDIGLIDIDENTGTIRYKGNGAFGRVVIKAVADDDSAGGKDNYESAEATKEIIIYRELDGSVTPHANSLDTTVPTFTASDSNIKTGGIIGTIHGTLGTPDTIGGSTTTYRYGLKAGVGNASFFSVNSDTGVITATANLAVQSYSITITISDNWSTKEIPVTINVGMSAAENLKFYESSSSNTIINTKSAKVTDTNVVVYATVKGSTNTNPVTYKIKDGSTNVIEVNSNSGAITIHGVGSVTIVAEKQGASGQADASAELTFTVTAGAQNFIYTDSAGNELPKSGNNYSAKTEEYAPNKTLQLYTAGNPTGSNVTYQLKAGAPTDVISVDASGLVTILNATQTAQTGKVIVQATSHDPTGNYEDKTIELPINIDKGTRTIAFAENPIYVVSGKGQVVPVTEVDGVTDTDGDVLIEIDSNEDHTIAWTNDNKTIDYNYSGEEGKDIKIHATKPMNRNYKLAETDGTLHIMGPDESMLAITSPGQIIYGDHFTIRSTQFDADSTNVQYTFEVDKTTYISSPTVSGNSAQFDALKASGTNKTTVTVTRTANGEAPLSKKVQVTVLPKPIEIMIDDKEKLKGEPNPNLTYQDFRSELVTWNGVQDSIQENDIKLSTTAKTDSNAGDYPIKGDNNTLNRTYPNYSFTFKEGTLTINEETIEDDWYHVELDDGNSTVYTGNWTNQDVNIISDHNEYINMSLDQSTWKPSQVTVTREGEIIQSFWMKKDSGAITKVKQEIIRIDKTAPKVKNIKAKDSNNKLQDIINKLSGGIFFKPGTTFEITTSDTKDDLKVSGTKEVAYKVYKTEAQSRAGDELIKEGSLTVTNEKASITISETTGKYKVCVTATDNAGNTSTESCHEAELKKIDVDVDGDGKPDFNDPDGDGCPDLNIKWKDPNDESKWVVINGDRNNDKIPDLNIDSDGDGIPDLNIDTDNDGKPDLNLVILKKIDWKPSKCVKADIDNGILEEYCTGTGVKAVINVDTDNDGIPNINIDNKGDFKPHLNISKDGVNASVNITDVHEWKPEKNYTSGKFTFDSVGNEYKPQINVDSDGDGRPDINIDLDGDGVPDINIDTDGDNIPNINIDSDGDGIPDVNVDIDDDGNPDENIKDITEWKPNKDVDGDVPYDTMDFGEQEEPQKPSEPTKPNQPANGTDVKGSYYPGDNVGGAITGDETNLLLYINSILFSVGLISYLIYRTQKLK